MQKAELSSGRKVLILSICCMSLLMVSLDVTILNVALPSLQLDLNATISGAQWTIDAYTLVLASLLLLSGSTADRVGRRRIFQIGLSLFTLGSLLCSLAPTLEWLVICRMLQAVGGSMLNPVAMSIITNVFTEPKERARAIGAWSGVLGISMALGPLIGGALVDSIGWRSIFWLNIPVGIAALALTARFVPESKAPRPRRVDPVGQLFVVGFLASLIYAIIEAPVLGWGSPFIGACFGFSVLCVIGLILYERRRPEPLIDLKFFRSAPFSGASIIALCAFAALGGFLFLNTLYLQYVRHYSALRAGLYLLPMAGAMVIIGPVSGSIVGKRGPRIPLIVGAISLSVAALMFAIGGSNVPDGQLFVGYALIGAGIGMLNVAITNTAISGMPRSQAGVAAATTSTNRQVGQSLGVAVIGSVLATHASQVTAGPAFDSGSNMCWWIISGCGIVALVVAAVTTGAWARQTALHAARTIEAEEQHLYAPAT